MIRASVRLGICLGLVAAGAGMARAQVVQLPSFQQSAVSTTVMVPDRGMTSLGGVQRGAMGSRSQGVPLLGGVPGANQLLRNRGIGSSLSSSSFGVSATIIDLQELDREIRGAAAAGRSRDAEEARVAEKAAFLSQHITRQTGDITRQTGDITRQTGERVSTRSRSSGKFAAVPEQRPAPRRAVR